MVPDHSIKKTLSRPLQRHRDDLPDLTILINRLIFIFSMVVEWYKEFRPAFGCAQHLKAGQNAQHTFELWMNRRINWNSEMDSNY